MWKLKHKESVNLSIFPVNQLLSESALWNFPNNVSQMSGLEAIIGVAFDTSAWLTVFSTLVLSDEQMYMGLSSETVIKSIKGFGNIEL